MSSSRCFSVDISDDHDDADAIDAVDVDAEDVGTDKLALLTHCGSVNNNKTAKTSFAGNFCWSSLILSSLEEE